MHIILIVAAIEIKARTVWSHNFVWLYVKEKDGCGSEY
jgi:hypothetical protein